MMMMMYADDTTLSVVGDYVGVVINKALTSTQPVVQKQQAEHTYREVRSHD